MANSHTVVVPAFTVGTVMMLGVLMALRKANGAKWCQRRLVGPLRTFIGPPTPIDTLGLATLITAAEIERDAAARALKAHCVECGKCKWARR